MAAQAQQQQLQGGQDVTEDRQEIGVTEERPRGMGGRRQVASE